MYSEKSPCIGFCTPQKDKCIGCSRTLEQISNWSIYSNYEKRQINLNISNKKIVFVCSEPFDFEKEKYEEQYDIFFLTNWDDLIYLCQNRTVYAVLFKDKDVDGDEFIENNDKVIELRNYNVKCKVMSIKHFFN